MAGHRGDGLYRKSPHVEFQAVEDGYVFYDSDAREIIFLNLTAAAIFELCAMPLTTDAIVEGLRVNGHRTIDDEAVESCLVQMVDHRLLLAAQ